MRRPHFWVLMGPSVFMLVYNIYISLRPSFFVSCVMGVSVECRGFCLVDRFGLALLFVVYSLMINHLYGRRRWYSLPSFIF